METLLGVAGEGATGLAGLFARSTSETFAMVSIVAVGLMPVISAHVIVECLAALVPGWDRLRTGGPAGRARLTRVVGWVSLATAALQAHGIALYLESLGGWELPYPVVTEPGWGFRLLVICTLTATTMLLWAGTWLVERHGLGNGFSVLIGWSVLWLLHDFGVQALELARAGVLPLADPLIALGLAAFTGWLGWWGLETRRHALPATGLRVGRHPLPNAGLTPLEEEAGRLMARGTLASLLFFGAYLAANVVGNTTSMLHATLGSLLVMIAVLIARDLAGEWAFRRRHGAVARVWPLHRVYAVLPVLALLEGEGIPAYPRAFGHRVLLNFFGPYVPVELLVPTAEAERATQLLRSRLLPPDPEPEEEEAPALQSAA
ncbi:MAG: hypothetical protein P1V51_11240 [Deltaproteobacteria bacterium]|nr:hypothetical protein [Deltaproteobacteria bacterium]